MLNNPVPYPYRLGTSKFFPNVPKWRPKAVMPYSWLNISSWSNRRGGLPSDSSKIYA